MRIADLLALKPLKRRTLQAPPMLYTGAATCPTRAAAVAAVVDSTQAPLTSASFLMTSPTEGEEIAIVLAVTHSPHLKTTLTSGSKSAILNFLYARVSPATLSDLLKAQNTQFRSSTLVWAPT